MNLRSIGSTVASAALLLASGVVHADYQVVYDQGPQSGALAGTYESITDATNFSDAFTFATQTTVTGINYFTTIDLSSRTGSSDFRYRYASDPNLPGPVGSITGTSGYADFRAVGNGLYRLHFDTGAITFNPGDTWYAGVSGNGFDAGALAIRTPADGRMAQFFGDTYLGLQPHGDLMFQLTVGNVPEPQTWLLFGAGAFGLCLVARRRRQA